MSRFNRGNPDHTATCTRTACSAREPHQAGRHLDQRDELYDGPHGVLQVLPLSCRESARRIVREVPGLMPEVIDMAEEIERLQGQVTAVSVDRDNKVRDALARSESCEYHGRQIRELGAQLHAANRRASAEEAGRLALVSFLQVVRDFVDAHRKRTAPGGPTVTKMTDALAEAVKKAEAAHMRAWKR